MLKGLKLNAAEVPPIFGEIYDAMGQDLEALYHDKAFRSAYERLSADDFSESIQTFTHYAASYNAFHRRERRLWSLKIGTGEIPSGLEKSFRDSIPEGRQNFEDAFKAIDDALVTLGDAGFGPVVEQHLASFTSTIADNSHPFAELILSYLRGIQCSTAMIEEIRQSFSIVEHDFLGVAGGEFGKLREVLGESVRAQLAILEHTEEEGFDYLRGRFGPPSWAITAANILQAAGVSISAWAIVVIIVSLLAALVAICLAAPRGSWLREQCDKLEVTLPIFQF